MADIAKLPNEVGELFNFVDGETPLDAQRMNPLIAKINEIIVAVNAGYPSGETDITDAFSILKSGYALNVKNSPTGSTRQSTQVTSGVVDILYGDVSAYRGKTLKFSGMTYRSGSGGGVAWGGQFYTGAVPSVTTASKNFINEPYVQYADSGVSGDGFLAELELEIPEDAVSFACTFFNATKQAEKGISFYAKVI